MAGTRADVPFDMPKDPNWDLLAGALDNLGEVVKRLTKAIEAPPPGSPLGGAAKTGFGSTGSATHLPQGYQYAPYGSSAPSQIPAPQTFPPNQPFGQPNKPRGPGVPMPQPKWMQSVDANAPHQPYGPPNKHPGVSVPMPPLRWINPPEDKKEVSGWSSITVAMGKFGMVVGMATLAIRTFGTALASASPNASATMNESWTLLKNRSTWPVHYLGEGAALSFQHSAERIGSPNVGRVAARSLETLAYHAIPQSPATDLPFNTWGDAGVSSAKMAARGAWHLAKSTVGYVAPPFVAAGLSAIPGGTDAKGKDQSALQWMESTSVGRFLWGAPTSEKSPLSRSLAGLPGGRFSSFEEYYDRMATTAMNMSENQAKILQDQLNLLKDSLPRIVEIIDSRQPAFR